jgi:hypothetical protein
MNFDPMYIHQSQLKAGEFGQNQPSHQPIEKPFDFSPFKFLWQIQVINTELVELATSKHKRLCLCPQVLFGKSTD